MAQFNYQRHVFRLPDFKPIVQRAVEFFKQSPLLNLTDIQRFPGSGVYALYYVGKFEKYAPLRSLYEKGVYWPIYVGKAVPPGRRTARTLSEQSQEASLYTRLQEHIRSIRKVENLAVEDFFCRFIILTEDLTDLIVPVESALIREYKPLWNSAIDGFGNHDPGKGRYNQSPSEWDVLHPGREWVRKLTGAPPQIGDILEKLTSHLEETLPKVF